jgi:putative endonuclease
MFFPFRSVRDWLRRLLARGADKPLGQRGEDAAARFLKRRGYRIVSRTDRSAPGELDIVAVDRGTVVFVEVKTRASAEAGHPVEAVDPAKQRRLTRLAVTWLKRRGLLERPARFDVVAITWPEGQRRPIVEHFPNAFEAAGKWEFYS